MDHAERRRFFYKINDALKWFIWFDSKKPGYISKTDNLLSDSTENWQFSQLMKFSTSIELNKKSRISPLKM